MKTDSDFSTKQSIDDIQIKKLPYTPPVLSLLETDEIAGGTGHLQEADGTGFVS